MGIIVVMVAKLEEIQNAVSDLPKGDYDRFREWFIERDWQVWDSQVEADSQAGKFDLMIASALSEKEDGKLKEL